MEIVNKVGAFVVVVSVLIVQSVGLKESAPCNFRAVYNFGDSNSDTGGGSAAFWPAGPPCGETFFGRPVGRGCDGRLIIDFIAEHLGLPGHLSPYLDSIATSFRHGANFAIGGSTIRPQNESMSLNGVPPFSLDIQMVQYNNFKARSGYFYNQAKKNYQRRNLARPEDFSKALYVFDIGQNDIAAGLRMNNDSKFHASTPDIVEQLAKAIQNVYDQGGRTFWVHNTGPIGCLPVTLHYHLKPEEVDSHGCLKSQNDFAIEFNRQLKDRVIKLRSELPEAALTYVDMYAAKYELIGNAKQQGFVDAAEICCGFHEEDIHVYCGHKLNVNGTEIYAGSCEDPSKYISWDGVHYTEAANHWIANHIINGSFSDPPLPITHACLAKPLIS